MEDIFESNELMKEFEKIYKEGGVIDKFVKELDKELSDPKKYTIQNFPRSIKSENAEISNNKNNEIKNINILQEKIKQTKELSFRIKGAKSNQNLIDQCIAKFKDSNKEKSSSNDDDDENFVDSTINHYKSIMDNDLSEICKSDSLFTFYQELNELTEITKIQIQNLAESMQFQSLSDFYNK